MEREAYTAGMRAIIPFAVLGLLGCDTETTPPSSGDSGAIPVIDAGGLGLGDGGLGVTDGGIDAAMEQTGGSCQSTEDCEEYGDYCGGCRCFALAKSDPRPACTEKMVMCIAEPCHNRTVTCKNSKCAFLE